MSDKKKIITLGKRVTGRRSSCEKCKKEYKGKKGETEAVIWRGSVKKVFLEILQNSPENTCARVLFCRTFLPCARVLF